MLIDSPLLQLTRKLLPASVFWPCVTFLKLDTFSSVIVMDDDDDDEEDELLLLLLWLVLLELLWLLSLFWLDELELSDCDSDLWKSFPFPRSFPFDCS